MILIMRAGRGAEMPVAVKAVMEGREGLVSRCRGCLVGDKGLVVMVVQMDRVAPEDSGNAWEQKQVRNFICDNLRRSLAESWKLEIGRAHV